MTSMHHKEKAKNFIFFQEVKPIKRMKLQGLKSQFKIFLH